MPSRKSMKLRVGEDAVVLEHVGNHRLAEALEDFGQRLPGDLGSLHGEQAELLVRIDPVARIVVIGRSPRPLHDLSPGRLAVRAHDVHPHLIEDHALHALI